MKSSFSENYSNIFTSLSARSASDEPILANENAATGNNSSVPVFMDFLRNVYSSIVTFKEVIEDFIAAGDILEIKESKQVCNEETKSTKAIDIVVIEEQKDVIEEKRTDKSSDAYASESKSFDELDNSSLEAILEENDVQSAETKEIEEISSGISERNSDDDGILYCIAFANSNESKPEDETKQETSELLTEHAADVIESDESIAGTNEASPEIIDTPESNNSSSTTASDSTLPESDTKEDQLVKSDEMESEFSMGSDLKSDEDVAQALETSPVKEVASTTSTEQRSED